MLEECDGFHSECEGLESLAIELRKFLEEFELPEVSENVLKTRSFPFNSLLIYSYRFIKFYDIIIRLCSIFLSSENTSTDD